MGFVQNQLAMARKRRILTVVDTLSRLRPAADPRFACRREEAEQRLECVCARGG